MNDYEDYVKSDEWKSVKERLIKERGRVCEKCGQEKPKSMHLHHKNYDNVLGKERDEDLMLLCEDCHNELHQDLEFFDNIETVGLCPECRRPMKTKGNKFICDDCGIEIEPKINGRENEQRD